MKTQIGSVLLSAFADEASKNPREMFSALTAMGLSNYTPRFFDFGEGPINSMKLSDAQLAEVLSLQEEFGVRAASLGSPVGKSKLVDREDGNKAPFLTLEQVLGQLDRALSLCNRFSTSRLRAFSFYGLHGEDPRKYLTKAADYVASCVERCAAAKVVYGMEVEANLVGQNAELLVAICEHVKSPWLKLVWDGGNQHSQGYDTENCLEQFTSMLPYLGWMHMKDYTGPMPDVTGRVHEDSLRHFCTPDIGGSGYEAVFNLLGHHFKEITARLAEVNVEDFLIDLEPHLKGGGQFGGYSGPDGLGAACRITVEMLRAARLEPKLIDFAEISNRRGF